MPKTNRKRTGSHAGVMAKGLKCYLVTFNVVACLGWSLCLYLVAEELWNSANYVGVYGRTHRVLRIVQSFSILEVLHALFDWVRSPLMTTSIQVASRLLLVWGISSGLATPNAYEHWSYTTMLLAWSITEIVRYSFYTSSLLSKEPLALLQWCRYNFFLVLYPLGVTSEIFQILKSHHMALAAGNRLAIKYGVSKHFEQVGGAGVLLYYAIIVVVIAYVPGLPKLYFYMLKQRKKYLESKSAPQRLRKRR